MEPDDLKAAWQSLSLQLERSDALQWQLLRDRKLDKVRASLRPLFWGQIAQILFGLPFIALATLLWASGPAHASSIVAGVVVHAYGVVTIMAAGTVLAQIGSIDYAASVMEIQKKLARTRTLYVRSGMVVGLPWWFLWVAVLMVLAGLRDVSLIQQAPSILWIGGGIGVLGLAASWWFHRWSRKPERASLGRRLEDSLTGASLRKAQRVTQEIRDFEQE